MWGLFGFFFAIVVFMCVLEIANDVCMPFMFNRINGNDLMMVHYEISA